MISQSSCTASWAKNFKQEKQFSKIDPSLLNKMIHALALLELLKVNGLDFILKGGTSLILLLSEPKRFSIDIDIITESNKNDLEKILEKVVKNTVFKKHEVDERKSNTDIPKAHYKFYFDSEFQKGQSYILLDILFDKNHYPKVMEVPIISSWIKIEGAFEKVTVPTIEAITGDKMTAFAPNTTGIPYNKGKDLEIIKQLYDVGNLFEFVADLKVLYNSFKNNAENEIRFRKLEINFTGVVDDIINTSLLLSRRDYGKDADADDQIKFKELSSGIKKIKNYLIGNNFRIDDAIEAAEKASYLAAKIKYRDFSKIEFYSKDINSKAITIKHPEYAFLNKLKKIPTSSFYYWYKAIEIITRSSNFSP